MIYLLHVENSPTVRIALRSRIRKRFSDIEIMPATRLVMARDQIGALAPRAFGFAILDWSLPDGTADELLPLLGSTRVVFLTSHKVPIVGATVIQKDAAWPGKIERMLRA